MLNRVKGAHILMVALVLCGLRVALHLRSIAHRRNGIDELCATLEPVRGSLGKHADIGFRTDRRPPQREELLFRSQFALAPVILTRPVSDTILVVDGQHWLDSNARGLQRLWRSKGPSGLTAELVVISGGAQ